MTLTHVNTAAWYEVRISSSRTIRKIIDRKFDTAYSRRRSRVWHDGWREFCDRSGIPQHCLYRLGLDPIRTCRRDGRGFTHWNDEGTIPPACAMCHAGAGLRMFYGFDGSATGEVTELPVGGVIDCETCHDKDGKRKSALSAKRTSRACAANDRIGKRPYRLPGMTAFGKLRCTAAG